MVSSNSWNYSWISNSWHGTVLHYKHMNRLTTCCTAGLLCTLFLLSLYLFQVRSSRAFLISLKYLLTIIKQIFLFSAIFFVLEYEHSHLQDSTVCNSITFRMSKQRFTCARTASTWKVPVTVSSSIVLAVSSSIVLVWLKTIKVWIFFLVLSTTQ